uniref:Uncharacterized protein n=1 Tax=Amorphochlora amoebiformis TaxID=1561963 RepID=A0A7S0D5V2_9EUKA
MAISISFVALFYYEDADHKSVKPPSHRKLPPDSVSGKVFRYTIGSAEDEPKALLQAATVFCSFFWIFVATLSMGLNWNTAALRAKGAKLKVFEKNIHGNKEEVEVHREENEELQKNQRELRSESDRLRRAIDTLNKSKLHLHGSIGDTKEVNSRIEQELERGIKMMDARVALAEKMKKIQKDNWGIEVKYKIEHDLDKARAVFDSVSPKYPHEIDSSIFPTLKNTLIFHFRGKGFHKLQYSDFVSSYYAKAFTKSDYVACMERKFKEVAAEDIAEKGTKLDKEQKSLVDDLAKLKAEFQKAKAEGHESWMGYLFRKSKKKKNFPTQNWQGQLFARSQVLSVGGLHIHPMSQPHL